MINTNDYIMRVGMINNYIESARGLSRAVRNETLSAQLDGIARQLLKISNVYTQLVETYEDPRTIKQLEQPRKELPKEIKLRLEMSAQKLELGEFRMQEYLRKEVGITDERTLTVMSTRTEEFYFELISFLRDNLDSMDSSGHGKNGKDENE
ncbi:MAG: hypothetical protein Q7S74_05715 [Nanoarchaeota archaeon]|nr:hypothetical protein [Nanoarchaeota archaeon]